MNIQLSEQDLAFRAMVREFFDENTPDAWKKRVRAGVRLEPHEYVVWQKKMFERGWAAPTWPKEYGGPGWSPTQIAIFEQESARADAPQQYHQGLELIGPIIFTYGSEAQKAKYLPLILNGDDWWCQGYSEPGAGSDLAALTTRAVRDGDDYVIDGQKMWTSYAHVSTRMFCLVRTESEAKRQAGISLLLVDMDTPGVQVRPVITLDEHHHTNEVFLDSVRTPIENLVGEEGKGWGYAKVLLDRERGVTASNGLRLSLQVRALKARARAVRDGRRALLDDPLFRTRLAQIEVEVLALEYLVKRNIADMEGGVDSGPRASRLKIRWSELVQRITELWAEALGYDAIAFAPADGADESSLPQGPPYPMRAALYSRVTTIFGGSNEIQRNIIARRMLAL
jgi:alkylation response protein AidB-like acyl-CoA dehydrogenase